MIATAGAPSPTRDADPTPRCRWCASDNGDIVLDLGRQPAADHFPLADDPGQDPAYALRLWCCAGCGLVQLAEDATSPEEPRGVEPVALIEQARAAVARVAAAGLLTPGTTVREFGSPHGGSWSGHLTDRGCVPVAAGDGPADVVLDCFGLMHDADQAAALAERVAALRPGGTLLVQFHALRTILRDGQWNAVRHGHVAYYSTTALVRMARGIGLVPRSAWTFDLYGGTVLLAATRPDPAQTTPLPPPDAGLRDLLDADVEAGVTDPDRLRSLDRHCAEGAAALRVLLRTAHDRGDRVLGYGAASRAVPLLNRAAIGPDLLPAIVDLATAKHGRAVAGVRVPIVGPERLLADRPDQVVLFVPDLLPEVRDRFPEVEDTGGRWVLTEPTVGPVAPARPVRPAGAHSPALVGTARAPVGIGLPVYNGEPYLRRALDTLLAQRDVDFELLIADNHSTDGTEELCREVAAADTRVRYLRRPVNVGAVGNHNRLLTELTNPVVGWAAADDEYPADRLRVLAAALDEHPSAVLVYGDAVQIDEQGGHRVGWRDPCRTDHPDPVVRMHDLVRLDHPALQLYGLMRRETVLRTGLHPPIGTGDRVLLAELALHGPFVRVGRDLLHHRVHPGQLSRRTSAREYARVEAADQRRWVLPNVDEGRWYLRAVRRAPLSRRNRVRAMWALRSWLRVNAVPMARNGLRVASDELRSLSRRHGRSDGRH